jgi:hypothetical protein
MNIILILADIVFLLTVPISAMNRALLGEILHPITCDRLLSRQEGSGFDEL